MLDARGAAGHQGLAQTPGPGATSPLFDATAGTAAVDGPVGAVGSEASPFQALQNASVVRSAATGVELLIPVTMLCACLRGLHVPALKVAALEMVAFAAGWLDAATVLARLLRRAAATATTAGRV
eukprot:c12058_g1_i2.p2 GENE.c12058_g1_i2~~c12058_g1_i2.p2  ORF type:complete len:125 (+),score=16.96 c12058_g1_i2:87-461(+)